MHNLFVLTFNLNTHGSTRTPVQFGEVSGGFTFIGFVYFDVFNFLIFGIPGIRYWKTDIASAVWDRIPSDFNPGLVDLGNSLYNVFTAAFS